MNLKIDINLVDFLLDIYNIYLLIENLTHWQKYLFLRQYYMQLN